jgi:uncharacterized protein with GYD domain
MTRMPAPADAVLRGAGGRCAVTTYIMLINWTDQVYLTMGEYDMVAVAEAPDDAVVARFALILGQAGNIRTRTLKAFPELAYREIIASMG